jgi:hypothetical protein
MDMTIRIADDGTGTELGSLSQWLKADDRFAGRTRVLRGATTRDILSGGLPEAIAVALAPGGVVTAAATVLITWLRHRTGTVKVTGTRPDGTAFEIDATQVRNLDAAGIRALTEDIARTGQDLAATAEEPQE